MYNVSLLVFSLFLSSCTFLKNYESDNIYEEIAEEIIKYKTGHDIDLTPFSPELSQLIKTK